LEPFDDIGAPRHAKAASPESIKRGGDRRERVRLVFHHCDDNLACAHPTILIANSRLGSPSIGKRGEAPAGSFGPDVVRVQ